MNESDRHINFKLMRDHILGLQDAEQPRGGKKYWRSLEELADTPQFREFVAREFPQQAEGWNDPVERRTFLKLMGASLALAGLSGCVFQPPEKIVPYVKQPDEHVPGKALFFATAAPILGVATPVLVRSNEGRPTKIEGNSLHPSNRPPDIPADDPIREIRGITATDIFTQASILSLYDPDRSQTLTYREDIRTWTAFVGEFRQALEQQRGKQGAGIRILTESIISPTIGAQLREISTTFPQAKWHQYQPLNNDNANAGAVTAFGQPVNITYRFDLAQRVLSLDADFLASRPWNLRHAKDFIAGRQVTEASRQMNRLYVIETTPSNTGAMADHAWTIKPSQMEALVREIVTGQGVGSLPWIEPLRRDLQQHQGTSIVIAGESQPPIVHALAHAMNNQLGNVGKTVFYSDAVEVRPEDHRTSLQNLINDIDAGLVDLLVIIGGNPVYNTPVDQKLTFERLQKVKGLRVHLSEYKDETSELCHWHVPAAHYLESWSDTRSYDGTVTIIQPLIQPLYDGRTAHELLTLFSDQYDRRPYDIVKSFWQGEQSKTGSTSDFETWWRQAIHDGFIPNTALPTKTLSFQAGAANPNPVSESTSQPGSINPSSAAASGTVELIFRPDPSIYDGRFANNGWLQELPKPLTKVTWDNVALVSPNTAQQITHGNNGSGAVKGREHYVPTVDLVTQQGGRVRVPLWIMPGQPDGVVTIHLGYGRRLAGRVGSGGLQDERIGFDAYSIRTSFEPWSTTGVRIEGPNGTHLLATTQLHFNLEDPNFSTDQRDIVRSETLDHFLQSEKHDKHEHPSIYPGYDYKDQAENAPNYAWGMAIDLNNCIGCNGCTVACQAENNIPVVGKHEVVRSREMHWIRIDTYFQGFDPNNPRGTNFMPVPCMHCENAPCEPVCPVHATVHSAEGLNDMVYNRCVGTKYCSNNCPYKVRRFNFFLYQDWDTPTYQLMRNPDVSVRSRGVMEKCTYCVQRIQNAKIQAELEDRHVRDGEIVTACQAVCPTEAIVFGDINDPNSRVSKLKQSSRDYSVLGELNTKPRTTYLAQLKNPNPELQNSEAGQSNNGSSEAGH
jgi:MoCo/4Fe-4S cofactor protein with predicted Tat translocation signal